HEQRGTCAQRIGGVVPDDICDVLPVGAVPLVAFVGTGRANCNVRDLGQNPWPGRAPGPERPVGIPRPEHGLIADPLVVCRTGDGPSRTVYGNRLDVRLGDGLVIFYVMV